MPIYEYRCPGCGHRFEKLMRLGATDLPPCPNCQAETQRLISTIARTVGECAPGGT